MPMPARLSSSLVRTDWDIIAYAQAVGGQDGSRQNREDVLACAYAPLNKAIYCSTTVTDEKGKILAWLLPGLLSRSREVR